MYIIYIDKVMILDLQTTTDRDNDKVKSIIQQERERGMAKVVARRKKIRKEKA